MSAEAGRAAMPRVSVLGLGLLGRPIARRLLGADFAVAGWNRSPVDAVPSDPPLLPTLAAAARADVCLLVLTDGAAVAAVLGQLVSHLAAGTIVVDMGTSDPAGSRAHAALLQERGVGWVDAPVSGGPEGAAAGSLAIMAGGETDAVARARPVLAALGNVVHVGGPGAGHTAKLINQLIVALAIEAVAEAVTLAEASGVDPALLQAALRGGFADSRILQLHGTRMIRRDYAPGGKARTQLKDLRLAEALAAAANLDLPHLQSVTQRFAELVARGDGDLDHSALHRLLDLRDAVRR
jgi:2-hydroxy-3-oxopropionate reductase